MNTQQIENNLERIETNSKVFIDRISWNKLCYSLHPDHFPEYLEFTTSKYAFLKIYKVDVTGDMFVIGE